MPLLYVCKDLYRWLHAGVQYIIATGAASTLRDALAINCPPSCNLFSELFLATPWIENWPRRYTRIEIWPNRYKRTL